MKGFWDEGFNIFGMKSSHILAGRRFYGSRTLGRKRVQKRFSKTMKGSKTLCLACDAEGFKDSVEKTWDKGFKVIGMKVHDTM